MRRAQAGLSARRARPLFSVVIPTLNRAALLGRAIRSVLDQTCQDFEIVVVNDGGATPALPSDPRVTLIEQTNRGLASARNTGARVARGRYLAFLDDDDTIVPDRLEVAQEGLAHADIVVCSKSYGVPASVDVQRFLVGSGLSAGQFAVARELFLPFDESFFHGEDLEWVIRMQRYKWHVDDRVGYQVCSHPGSRMTDSSRAAVESRLRLLCVQRPWFDSHPAALRYQLRYIGVEAVRLGDEVTARYAFLRAMKASPDFRTAARLVATYLPGMFKPKADQ